MRDYSHIDSYLNELLKDIYPQPDTEGHIVLAQEVIDFWMGRLTACNSVLDVGCGEGFCQPMFEKYGVKYTGIALGQDVANGKSKGRNVSKMDFSFLDFPNKSFDLVFSRHSLEHSPMPMLTLMEWRRVARAWLGLVVPAPEHYTFDGLNHYSVMTIPQLGSLLDQAGWKIIWQDIKMLTVDDGPWTAPDVPPPTHEVQQEYWLFCEKINRTRGE